jgi:hypothetical protein
MAIQLNPLSVPLGLVAGTLVALIGREEPLRFWPLLIVGCFATRMFATSAVATFTGLLTVIVIRQLNATMAGITLATELQYGEAILYDHAGRVLRGEQLYQPLDRPPYTVAAYTPVYYWLAAGARSVLGPGFASGRILTFLAGLAVAWAIAFVVGRQTRDRWAGVFAALLFLALGLPWVDRPADPLSEGNLFRLAASSFLGELIPSFPDLAVYKEDLLGVALSLATIAVLISGTTPRRLVVAGLFAGLAFLTKQVFIAAGLAGAIWLWRRNAENAMVFAGAGFILVFGTCLTLELTSRAFLANTVLANVNPMNPQVLIFNLALLARFQAGPFVLAVIFLFDRLRSREEDGSDLLLYYWVSSLLPLVGFAKVGGPAPITGWSSRRAPPCWRRFACGAALADLLFRRLALSSPSSRLPRPFLW